MGLKPAVPSMLSTLDLEGIMIIDMKHAGCFQAALAYARHWRTMYGVFVITLNGSFVARISYMRD